LRGACSTWSVHRYHHRHHGHEPNRKPNRKPNRRYDNGNNGYH
jgi:hypothetical protein